MYHCHHHRLKNHHRPVQQHRLQPVFLLLERTSREIKQFNRHFSVPYHYDITSQNDSTHSLSFREQIRYIPPREKYHLSHFTINELKQFLKDRFNELKDEVYRDNDDLKNNVQNYINDLNELTGYDYIKNMGIIPLYSLQAFKTYKHKNKLQHNIRNMYNLFPTTVLQAWLEYFIEEIEQNSSSSSNLTSVKTRHGLIDFLCKDYEKGQNHWEIQHNQFFEWFEEFSRLSDIQVLEKST